MYICICVYIHIHIHLSLSLYIYIYILFVSIYIYIYIYGNTHEAERQHKTDSKPNRLNQTIQHHTTCNQSYPQDVPGTERV